MATLLRVRDALEQADMIGLQALSEQLQAQPALVEAILEQLIALGKVERVSVEKSCCSGCNGCSQHDACGDTDLFRLIPAHP